MREIATDGGGEEVVRREDEGRLTIQATRYTGEVNIDGVLDESIYQSIAPITDFIQQIPDEGAAASEKTEAWVYFDDDNLYIAARNYESVPESEWVANEMRRDTFQLRSNDSFSVMLDTFLDRRNGVAFLVTPIGGFSDFAISNEGGGGRSVNSDWNIVWDSRTGRFDGGWTVEMQIPFRSLRYEPGAEQTWGIQLRRIIRRHNEASYFTALPISAARGNSIIAGLWRISEAGTLKELEVPARNFNLEIKPYGLGSVITNRQAQPPVNSASEQEFGLDVKFGITNNLTADFTYNTDFAQVEVDEQQVNLTRFSLFFPAKREFFLEVRGTFAFARPRPLDQAGGSVRRQGVLRPRVRARRARAQGRHHAAPRTARAVPQDAAPRAAFAVPQGRCHLVPGRAREHGRLGLCRAAYRGADQAHGRGLETGALRRPSRGRVAGRRVQQGPSRRTGQACRQGPHPMTMKTVRPSL